MRKLTISVDFDGVLHSYSSGWKGARVIPDAPVPGALEWLISMLPHFEVAISSARSGQWGGRRAMKRWLRCHLARMFLTAETWGSGFTGLLAAAGYDPGMDPPAHEADAFARHVVGRIKWPRLKPSAQLYIDDRAYRFDGPDTFPSAAAISAFKPWNKRSPVDG